MKRYFIIFFLFLSNLIFGQNKNVDKYFITFKSGFCDTSSFKCERQQLKYLTACEKIADYYYLSKKYDSALFYYKLPSELNDHSFLNNFTQPLRNRVIAKAGDMTISGVGTEPDTLKAYYYHYHFPLSKDNAFKLSFKYFKTINGILNLGRYDSNKGFYWEFEINPFMIQDTITLNKIIKEIINFSISKDSINLTFILESSSEELNNVYYRSLNYIKKGIEKYNRKKETKLDIDYGGGHWYLSKIAIPILKVSFE